MIETRISASDAHRLLFAHNHFDTSELICRRAHDEILVAKAQTLFWGKKRIDDVEIPAAFWWARGKAALTQNWSVGDFSTWIDQQVHCRAYGVTFLEADIEAMLPQIRSGPKVDRPAEGNFAPSGPCVGELGRQLGLTQNDAAQHIVRFCRARLIDSKCASIRWQTTGLYDEEEFEETNVAIPDWFWEHCADPPEAILNWQSGTFAGRGYIDGKLHIVRIKGAARYSTGNKTWQPLKVGTILKSGALVQTAADSYADIVL